MSERVIKAATSILKLWKHLIDESKGNCWHKHAERQAYHDSILAMKHAGLITGYDVEACAVGLPKDPESGDWRVSENEIRMIVGAGFSTNLEAVGFVFERAMKGDEKCLHALQLCYPEFVKAGRIPIGSTDKCGNFSMCPWDYEFAIYRHGANIFSDETLIPGVSIYEGEFVSDEEGERVYL